MRFLFEGGGRSGVRSAEDLGYALEAYCNDNLHLRDMLVDFSPTNDQPAKFFRCKADLLHDITVEIGACRESKASPAMWQRLGGRYWAEAEALELSRVAADSPSSGTNPRL